ncbi:LLM class F420-dependent oxidoreductase [Streptomyces fuscichromogenes]|uniref:LLM class F420-dependent oxidoreductase n=2 Tax=Streptomyces fuscichromogenes TaxID=1324013 RepID=A0A917XG80_9ACTN|nr:LLM class F420-dependent oxidoreductase [Streptomyces fuscichromogenes]GGN19957.1 LLM class F420-dependent oxidoreductase [Streptomyces fuscichromogenes]
MKLSMLLSRYTGDPVETAELVRDLESAGLDMVWVPEAYGFDAMTLVGYLAATTERVQIGTGIVNVFSRTPTLLAMSAAAADSLSRGRFALGIGASGPQVVEGFHGVPFDRPMQRIAETIEICRKVWRREEPLTYDGKVYRLPLPADRGTGLGKPLRLINHPYRAGIPVYWASLMERSVRATAELADGWLPLFFLPDKAAEVFGPALAAGTARRSPGLPPLDIVAGGPVAVGEKLPVDDLLDQERPTAARYIGGMGSRGRNFYNDLACRYGFEAEAKIIQDLYLDGRTREAEAAVPRKWLEQTTLIGPPGQVTERIHAYREAGVTALNLDPVGPDPARTVEAVRRLVDNL